MDALLPLAIEGLSLSYGKQTALQQVQLQLNLGECCCLIGHNGAGKSSLIKGLLDFHNIDQGQITLFGKNHKAPSSRANLAYLPERFVPPYFLSGLEFLKLSLESRQRKLDETALKALCERLKFPFEALKKPIRALSKGMSQKLGLMSVFLTQQPLFVLDEPMTGLDPEARHLVRNELIQLKQQGCAFLISTHMLIDIQEFADSVALLHHGQLRYFGTLDNCLQQFQANNLEAAYLTCIQSSQDSHQAPTDSISV